MLTEIASAADKKMHLEIMGISLPEKQLTFKLRKGKRSMAFVMDKFDLEWLFKVLGRLTEEK